MQPVNTFFATSSFRLSPLSAVNSTVVFVVMTTLLALSFLLAQTWYGITFQPDKRDKNQVMVATLNPATVQQASLVGKRVYAISDGHLTVPLSANLLHDHLTLSSYEQYRDYFDQHALLANIVDGKNIVLTLEGQQQVAISSIEKSSVYSLPSIFWSFLLTNTVGLFVGVLVWTTRPRRIETNLLLTAGIMFYLEGVLSSTFMSRELTFQPPWYEWLTNLEVVFIQLFASSLIAILLYYPRRLARPVMLIPVFAIPQVIWLSTRIEALNVPLHLQISQYIGFFIVFTFVAREQWKKSHQNPVDRASLFWFFFSLFFPVSIIIALYVIPVAFAEQPLIHSWIPRLIVLGIFLGWAMGIIKYRLFSVERWWWRSWLWLLGGVLVLMVDFTLVALLNLNQMTALSVAIIISGFIYLPVRQWFFLKFTLGKRESLRDFLPSFTATMSSANSPEAFDQRWTDSLSQKFFPLHIEIYPASTQSASLVNNGLNLLVPGLNGEKSYQLVAKNQGRHLFNEEDVATANSLYAMVKMAVDASNARDEAAISERRRIMTDLHDTLGAELLTMTHQAGTKSDARRARSALQTLRETVQISLKTEPHVLESYMAQWRNEAVLRCEAAEVSLAWNPIGDSWDVAETEISSDQAISLTNVVRESISNALKHASPTTIIVELTLKGQEFSLIIRNDIQQQKDSSLPGTGLANIKSRIGAMQGSLDIQQTDIDDVAWWVVRIHVGL